MYLHHEEHNIEFNDDDDNSVDYNAQQKLLSALKRRDEFYEKYTIRIHSKNVTIENHGTKGQGNKIRNAKTGLYYDIKVGSKEEGLFFKVNNAVGRKGRQTSLMLYYDSPEQFENHHYTSVDDNVKVEWRRKTAELHKQLEQQRNQRYSLIR